MTDKKDNGLLVGYLVSGEIIIKKVGGSWFVNILTARWWDNGKR